MYPDEQMKTISGLVGTANQEPKAFLIIRECHKIVDQIGDVTSMIRYSGPEKDGSIQEGGPTPLLNQLELLRVKLQILLESYRV